jgi:Mycothiol maleylpyruvate isomerase N-terminal domain
MNRATFLATLRAGRAEWEALLATIPIDRMTEPGAAGDRSVKDVVAHVTWSEREMIGVARAHALVGSDLWRLSQDERNSL